MNLADNSHCADLHHRVRVLSRRRTTSSTNSATGSPMAVSRRASGAKRLLFEHNGVSDEGATHFGCNIRLCGLNWHALACSMGLYGSNDQRLLLLCAAPLPANARAQQPLPPPPPPLPPSGFPARLQQWPGGRTSAWAVPKLGADNPAAVWIEDDPGRAGALQP
jgi:hypothetical protein